MSRSHKANVLYGRQDLRIEHVETVMPGPGEVQIAPRATGLCGTDLHYYTEGKNGMFVVTDPLILGHESAGEVVAIGEGVMSIKRGDRVVVEPQRPCFRCSSCRRGQNNLCSRMKFGGSASSQPPVQGSLQELYTHPEELVYRLPDSVSFVEGAIIEPLSVAIHAVNRSNLRAGQHVLITGAGAIGLLCAAVAKWSGAASVSMIDVEASRLEFAKSHGFADAVFTIPFNGGPDESKADFTARMASLAAEQSGLSPPAISYECTGVESCANICLHSAAVGGKVVIVGMGKPLQEVSLGTAAVKEVDILAVWRYANTFPTAIALLEARRIDVGALVTHQFDLLEAKAAFDLIASRPKDLVKCVVTSTRTL